MRRPIPLAAGLQGSEDDRFVDLEIEQVGASNSKFPVVNWEIREDELDGRMIVSHRRNTGEEIERLLSRARAIDRRSVAAIMIGEVSAA